jgi:hypothetical protein
MYRFRDMVDAVMPHPVARRLPLSFDPDGLRRDLNAVDPKWWTPHAGRYYIGGWESVTLWAPGGDMRAKWSARAACGPTEALRQSPYIQAVLDALPGNKNLVRLLRLMPGAHIRRHSDAMDRISRDCVRLHVPIITSQQVAFTVRDSLLAMGPGELWHVDVRFPHEVKNEGTSPRVHIVADILSNSELRQLMDRAEPVEKGFLTGYYAKHALGALSRRVGTAFGFTGN